METFNAILLQNGFTWIYITNLFENMQRQHVLSNSLYLVLIHTIIYSFYVKS